MQSVASNKPLRIMPRGTTRRRKWLAVGLLCLLPITGCTNPDEPTLDLPVAQPTPAPLNTATPTREPMAAIVNGNGILLTDFLEEVARYEQAMSELGIDLATEGAYQQEILDSLVDRELLVQGALEEGFEISVEALDQRMTSLADEMGGNEALGAWLIANHYSVVSFSRGLFAEMMAAQFVQLLAGSVPDTVEQVHARHILVDTQAEGQALLDDLAGGSDFAALARLHSRDLSTRPGGGDLGWFPEGYLLVPEVEAVAFSLAKSEISGVIESGLGFHIVQSLDRAERPLTLDMRLSLQEKAVLDWLQVMRERSVIERMLPE